MSASAKSLDLGFGSPEDAPSKPLSAFERAGISLRERADSWFPERQILIRGPGNVSALRLSQRAQLLAAGLAAFALLALLLTSVGLCIACAAESRAAAAAGRLQAALTLAEAQTARETAAYQLAAAQRDQAVAQANHERDVAVAQAVRGRDLALAQAIRDRDLAVAQAIHDRDVAVARAQQLQEAAVAHANQVAASDSAALNALLRQTESTIDQVQSVIRSTGLDPNRLVAQPGPPSAANGAPSPAAMTNLPATPLPLPPPPLPRRAAALNQAGINALNAGDAPAAAPAPLSAPTAAPVPAFTVPPGLPSNDAARADLLIGDLAWLSQLNDVLTQLPLSAPVAQTAISSGYGLRADPFTGAPEFHVGIDLPGPIGAPVYATAPGIVVFAGPSTGYGNLVTIDHGYGLSTRYSHLDKILVKVGAAVTLHQEIGLMGNTGWSTGPHLLYETRVDGQPQNPLNFIKVNPYDVQN